VALDVLRAARKTACHRLLADALTQRLDRAGVPAGLRARLGQTIERTLALVETALLDGAAERLARQAASALYHVASAAVMACEAMAIATQGGDARRLLLARLVLDHRLAPRDPLAADDLDHATAIEDALLGDAPVPLAAATALV